VNGAPLTDWLHGSNLESDGSLRNHQRIAPDYTTNLYQNIDALLTDALVASISGGFTRAGRGVRRTQPQRLRPAAIRARRAVYKTTTSRVYYPQGCDWGTGNRLRTR